MLKVICNIDKVIRGNNQRTYIKYYGCQPCKFSDYQMFEHDQHDTEKRLATAHSAVAPLENNLLDINLPQYKDLANKIYYIEDFSNYRYIALFDESTKVNNVNNIFGITWVYSAIIRHILPDYRNTLFSNALEYINSWFTDKPLGDIAPKENFQTLWEKHFLFSLPPEATYNRLAGTIIKARYNDGTGTQYYAIDPFFLRHLLFKKENSKCMQLYDEPEALSNNFSSDLAYQEYKNHLPKLVGLKYFEILNKIRNCINLEARENMLLNDETDTFDLKPASNELTSIKTYNFIKICKDLGGVLFPISEVAYQTQEKCARGEINSDDVTWQLIGSNELYKLNCDTINETLVAVGNISDFYMF